MDAASRPLTGKRKRFVDEYLKDLNASQAALRAGYSAATAGSIGHENLKKPEIQKAIQAAMEDRSSRTQITADAVLKAVHEIAEEARAAEKYGDALRGYELVGKHLRMWTDKTEISGELPVPNFNFSFVTPDASRDG